MTSRSHTQDLRDDLLADLRSVAPPATPPPASVVPPAEDEAAGRRAVPESSAPSVEVRISRQSWAGPRLRTDPAAPGLVLSAGPLRVHLALSHG